MTIRHMKIFLKVCEKNNSITGAAKELYMTQPSVTLAVQEIEKYYGIRLFDRIARRLYLTEAGKEYRAYAARLMACYDDMEKRFRSWDTHGSIRIGASMTVGAHLMSGYVKSFEERHPEITVFAVVEPSRMLEKKLFSNELDIALAETPSYQEALCREEYMLDHMSLIVPRREPYYKGMCFKAADLCKERFILREKGSGTREIFEKEMEKKGIYIEPVWETASTTALISAVAGGMGVSVVPELTARKAEAGKDVWRAEIEDMVFTQSFYIVYHKDKWLTPLMREFIDIVKNQAP